jgi:hypothetical protein
VTLGILQIQFGSQDILALLVEMSLIYPVAGFCGDADEYSGCMPAGQFLEHSIVDIPGKIRYHGAVFEARI